MKDAISELKAACSAQPSLSAQALIKQGVTSWLGGRAAPAPDGLIGLAQRGGFKLLVPADQIIAATKHEDMFLVKVRSDADVLITLEQVAKADLRACGCGEVRPGSLAQDAGGGGPTDAGVPPAAREAETTCTVITAPFVAGGVVISLVVGVVCTTQ
jgi:hypothetical protein